MATACNHSLDLGEEGVSSTIAALRARGIAWNGMNEHDDDAQRVTVLERKGVRIGVVAHTFGLNARRPPAGRPNIVNHTNLLDAAADVDLHLLEAQLRDGKGVGVDFFVANLHWGMEFELFPRASQIELGHRIAELGVDLIVGHHPHVIQPVEYYRTSRDPGRIVPIYYSLGNLLTPLSAPEMCRSAIARVDVVKGRCGRTYARRADLIEVDQRADLDHQQLTLTSRSGRYVGLGARQVVGQK